MSLRSVPVLLGLFALVACGQSTTPRSGPIPPIVA
jgi:predicted small lipoprotein YifL